MLPREALLKGSRQPQALAPLIDLAEEAVRTWQPLWSPFVAADLREEAEARLGALAELQLSSAGGWPQAERRRLLLQRADLAVGAAAAEGEPAPIAGLLVNGNFLFDPASADDVRQALLGSGVDPGELGDLWIQGDRGAQLMLTPACAQRLDGTALLVRSVETLLEAVPCDQLHPPTPRSPKQLSSVEASLRLDAVASAGFGLSRARMAELIRQGAVRVNWQVVTSPSRELAAADRVRLDQRGELEILEVSRTKRERWRLVMQRR